MILLLLSVAIGVAAVVVAAVVVAVVAVAAVIDVGDVADDVL